MHQSQILFTTNLTFKIGHLEITEDFMVFEKLSGILLGFPFFDKNEITIDAHNRYLHFPEFTFQLNLMQTAGSKTSKRFNNKRKIYLKTTTRVIIHPGEQKMIEHMPYQPLEADHQIGIVEPTTKLENIGVCLTSTINKMLKDKPIQLMAINTTEVPITIARHTTCNLHDNHTRTSSLSYPIRAQIAGNR